MYGQMFSSKFQIILSIQGAGHREKLFVHVPEISREKPQNIPFLLPIMMLSLLYS